MGKNNSIWKSENIVRQAFEGANSRKEILLRLGECLGSANYAALRYWATEYDLEIPDGVAYQRSGIPRQDKTRLEDVLIENSTYSRGALKKRLISEGILENICNICSQLPWWNEKPLSLQIDHINGVSNDNRLENLQIICGHCHSQTDTYCGKNKSYKKKIYLCVCGNERTKNSIECQSCSGIKRRKIVWPSNEDLLDMLAKSNYTQVGKQLGVSDNAVRAHLRNKKY